MKNWLSDRSNWIDNQFIQNPSYSPAGGTVSPNQNISIINTYGSGTIYYTKDATDPRLSGGSISANALIYNGSFNITQPGITYVTARIKLGSNWGAVCKLAFYVNDNYQDVVINEIHYNPTDIGLIDGDQFEFIELKNKSNNPVNLTGLQFTDGIEYVFPEGSILPANGFVVLADDSLAFINQYGFSPDGNYGGNLSNAGEQVILADYYGNTIDIVLYDDANPWEIDADGIGSSLGLIDANTDNNQAANWGIQITPVTPNGENNFCNGSLSFNAIMANISCNGANDGFISGNGIGGNSPYTFQWSNGSNGNTITSLAPGIYTLTLTDAFGCPYVESLEITEPAAFTGSVTSTNESYYQANDGTAVVNVIGGTLPYSYSWSNGATTSSVNSLAPGNYSVNVLDANGCPFSENISINPLICNAIAVDVETHNETCLNSNNGLLVIRSVSNGTAPYSVLWSTGITTSVNNSLTTGTYQLNVTDNFGCPFQENYMIEVDNIVQASFTINNVSSANLNDGSISAIPSGGDAPYTYNWSNGSSSQNLNNVGLDVYSVTVTDANGCAEFFDQLSIDNSCVSTIIQQNYPAINSQIYQVAQFIQSNGMVNVNQTVSFKAGDYIEMVDDFEVIKGAEFEAIIDGCN